TNEQLRESLIQISSGTAYQDRLRQVLYSACSQLRATGACLFLHHAPTDSLQILATADPTLESDTDTYRVPERCAAPFPASALTLWEDFQQRLQPVLLDVRIPEDAARIRPEAVPWHLEHGRPVLMGLPLVIERRVLGYLSMTFAHIASKADLSDDAVLVGKSLASLIAMMVETHQLSIRAQDAAIAEEKNRLAQDLHDTLAGAFTGIFMQLQAANDLSEEESTRRSSLIRKAEDLARGGLRQVREFVHTLAFSDGDPDNVIHEMRTFVASVSDSVRLRTHFTIVGRERRLKPAAANAFLRVLQEAIGNTQRYASAKNIFVTMQFEASAGTLTVRDDGVGFDRTKVGDAGFGIAGMQARMHRLGGNVQIETTPGSGTTVIATLPACCEDEVNHD
ncbi:MAG TPA: sensor histidine kinase, partial [Edaphobacter sp.]|nr:sensor histidine kinase [Edaphobacter sp.]